MTSSWGVTKFILRRLVLGLVTLFIVSVIVFGATQLLPSDPAQTMLGRNATPASLQALRDQMGLDRPKINQYSHWLKGIVTGDPGDSFAAEVPITSLHLRSSGQLAVPAGVRLDRVCSVLVVARRVHGPQARRVRPS